jgi:hypothetical protein
MEPLLLRDEDFKKRILMRIFGRKRQQWRED